MKPMLIKNIHTLVTMNESSEILHHVDMLTTGNRIAAIGHNLTPPDDCEILDGTHRVVYPGFINTHHHFYQILTRNLPRVHNAKLFDWLTSLYEVWRELSEEAIDISTRIAAAELLLSGCTTSMDHFYVFPNMLTGQLLDVEIKAAAEMGIRFHPTRGSMSRGKTEGGLPPDDLTQSPDVILEDCERVISEFHDPSPYSMCRVSLAPCSPFSVTPELMKETSELARARSVRLHTHLCETKDEEEYCLQTHGMRPLDYMEETGWVGPDVWYAHGIYFNDDEIKRLSDTQTGIAHCPASNLRLGSGICRVPYLLDQGVPIGLAVDGSSSNDSSHFVREMQLALLVHRVGTGVDAMPPETVLKLATNGGSTILGQPEIGHLSVHSAADFCMFRLDEIWFAGAQHAPESAILFCGPPARADVTVVNGDIRVRDGKLVDQDEQTLVEKANAVSCAMVETAEKKLGISYRNKEQRPA